MKADFETAKAATAAKNQELNKCSKEIKELEKEKERHLKDAQAKSLEARKLSHKLKEWEKESKESAKMVAALLKANPWIEKEKAFFGHEGSDFDFRAKDVTQCAKRHKELKAEQVSRRMGCEFTCPLLYASNRWCLTSSSLARSLMMLSLVY
jgi:seryl-tRNA synthetase